MNCTEVQPFLDQLGTTPADRAISDEFGLRQHLASCSECQHAMRSLEQWDLQLSRAMVDVAIPDGMATRMIVALKGASPTDLEAVPTISKFVAGNRWLWSLITVAAVFLLGTSFWWALSSQDSRRLSPANISLLWDQSLETIPSDSALVKKVPRGWSSLNNVSSQNWKQSRLSNPRLTVSVRPFEIQLHRGAPEAGWLFVLPKSQWTSLPVNSVARAQVQYSADRVWIVWREGDLVYIIALAGTPQSLERLQHQLDGDHAVF